MSAHSIVGPSAAKRWINCPGSVLATKDLPDVESSYATEGTAAHTLTEWCRLKNVRAEQYLGAYIPVGDDTRMFVDQEMVDAANEFCDYVADLGGLALIEERVNYSSFVEGGFGTSDHISFVDRTCHVADFKYGKGVQVFAAGNEQLMLYALGTWIEFGYLYDFDEFVLHVVQPRLGHIDSWKISLNDLLAWTRDVAVPAGKLALTPGAPFKSGDWCQFCKLKATCKVRAQTVFETVVGDFEDLDASTVRDVPQLTNDEIATALVQVANIKRWCTDLQLHAMTQLRDGKKIGDWKLVAGKTSRDWAKPAPDVAAALLAAGVSPDTVYEPAVLRSPAQIEKRGKGNKKLVEALVSKSAGKPALAPGSDQRPGLAVDALQEFSDLGADESFN